MFTAVRAAGVWGNGPSPVILRFTILRFRIAWERDLQIADLKFEIPKGGLRLGVRLRLRQRGGLGSIVVQDFDDSTLRRAHPVFAGSRLKMHRHALGPFL